MNIKETMIKYMNTFDMEDDKINIKYYHTLEVADISKKLAKSLKLSKEDVELAEVIGYLHDIGRFEQVVEYESFSDKNMDHALYGVKILFERGLIKRFYDNEENYEIIKKAILYHNKLSIDEDLTKRELLFAKLIRDADKIDIFRARILQHSDIIEHDANPKVLEDYFEGRPISHKDVQSKTDSILMVLAFLSDINYPESLNILREKGYFLDYLESIKVNPLYQEMFIKVKEYALDKLNGGKSNVRKKI